MTKAEKETIIRWDEEEDVVWIWTCSRGPREKCIRMGADLAWKSTDKEGHDNGWQFKISKNRFSWGKKRRVSSEQAARLRQGRPHGGAPSAEVGR